MTYPATVGQLSVWRDLEKIPRERHWEANLQFVWDLPEGTTDEQVRAAIEGLAARHGSLRTRYVVDDQGLPRQWITDETGQICQGRDDRPEAQEREQRQVIDVTEHLPWRALIVRNQLVVTIHHMAADGVAALIMREDFLRLLAGEDLPPARGPLELALEQQSRDNPRLRNAERHWRRTLAAAPRAGEHERDSERLGAMLRTGIPMPQAHELAAAAGASLSSVLLAVYHRALCAVTGETVHLLYSMSNNRYDDEQAGIVTSLNQWVPLLLDAGTSNPGAPLATVAEKVHWRHFSALKHGVYSPDAAAAARAEQPGADAGYHYNPMLTPPGFPSGDRPVPSTVEVYPSPRASGPGFYVIARGLTSLEFELRVSRPGWDGSRVRAFADHVLGELHALSPAATARSS
ncbi:condensation domain-containing protein [Dactylosporangium sp. CS-033363]|uniref:condensation domain-containing protein n=1 Tax=Dactylosporangium sp. CS-033363 TaxID=3239935 RepID=UPI003D946660